MKKLILLILFIPQLTFAQQTLEGHVFGRVSDKLEPLVGALVVAPESGNAALAGDGGKYSLTILPQDNVLYVSYVGYVTDTVTINAPNQPDAVLIEIKNLKEVTITGKQDQSYISSLNQHKTDVITTEGLHKNACCNLAESFESNPSVDATISDAVTGSKQIQMLGLSGIYVQMQTDLLPGIRGLNVLTGLNDVPGPFVEAIHIRKGPGSVANGFEAITGQIDVEMIKPTKADKFFINGYGDTESRLELNTYVRNDIGKWSSLTMLHGSNLTQPIDGNADGFFDRPMFKRFNIVNRWQHISPKGKNNEFGVKWIYNEENGGNIESRYADLSALAYRIDNFYNRQEAFGKTCISLSDETENELGLQFFGTHHERSMSFGNSHFATEEFTGYVNALIQMTAKNTKHIYRFGPSAYVSKFTELLTHQHPVLNDSIVNITQTTFDLSHDEIIPGAFAEYTYDNLKKFSFIAGLRADYSPTKSFIATPRLHIRYKITDDLVARVSAGTGWRMPHPLTENINYFISSRAIIFDEEIKPEQAWNYGINITHRFMIAEREGEWSVDAYRTDFIEQAIVDLDRSPYEIHFSNLHGQSYSNSLQAQVKQMLFKDFILLVAAKWNDAQTTYNGALMQKPFSPTWRGLVNVSYTFWKERIKIDVTSQFVGEQRIPDLSGKISNDELITQSPSFTKFLGQITYHTKRFEIYAGAENISTDTQENPVIDSTNPFGPNFDAAMIWGPIMDPMFYAGFRFKILNK